MLLPNKYEDVSKNLLSIGSEIIVLLKTKRDIYGLYQKLKNKRNDKYALSFESYLLALDFLYAIGKIKLEKEEISLI